ncbi:MAG: hypothetical protein ABI639_05380 [Thermoanaerobaculia bacterium]
MKGAGALRAAAFIGGLLALNEVAVAGTGRSLSAWMSRAPRIDGRLSPGEWSAATAIDLGAGVELYIGNDGRTLYLAVLDANDLVSTPDDALELLFDDEGGTAPVLDDGSWPGTPCHAMPQVGEGWIDLRNEASGPHANYREYAGGYCPAQLVNDRLSFGIVARPEGVTYEAAIPLDGPAPLRASPGQRFGLLLQLYRNGAPVGCLPTCSVANVTDFRNLVLASRGCNTGPEPFGSGLPQVGLPLDWTSELAMGTGQGWLQSSVFADPVFCQENVTGGAGAAACVSTALETSARADALLRMPLPVAGQTAVTVRLLANFQVGGLHDYFSIYQRNADTSGDSFIFWLDTSHGGASGPGEALEFQLLFGASPPVELDFYHSTFSYGGQEGGFAQVDDVELLCGPTLFADGFDSGLSTHWSATAP